MRKLIAAVVALLAASPLFATMYITHANLDIAGYDFSKTDEYQFHYGWKAGGASNIYTLSKDTVIPASATTVDVFCGGDHPLIFDFSNGNHTLYLGKNGIYYVNTTTAAQRKTPDSEKGEHFMGEAYITYKGGTWKFYDSEAAGYDVGQGYIKIAGAWGSSHYESMNITLDGAKFITTQANSSAQMCVGTKDASVVLDNGAEVSAANQVQFVTGEESWADGNSIVVRNGSKVKAGNGVYTSVLQGSSSVDPGDIKCSITFEGEGTSLSGAGLYIGHQIGGTTITFKDGATGTFTGSSNIADNNAKSQKNKLVIDNGAKVTTPTFNCGVASAAGSYNNEIYIGKDSELAMRDRFMTSGGNNIVTIDNGTMSFTGATDVTWLCYFGYFDAKTTHECYGNELRLKGKAKLYTDYPSGTVYFTGDTKLSIELPADGNYDVAPIRCGILSFDGKSLMEITNLEAVRATLTSTKKIVLAECTQTISWAACTQLRAWLKEQGFDAWCTAAIDYDSTPKVFSITIQPLVLAAEVGGVTYSTYAEAMSALKEGGTFKVASALSEPCVFDGIKNVTLNISDTIALDDLQLVNAAKVRTSGAFKIGYSSETAGKERPVENKTLTIGDGSTLTVATQFMVCGTNNTVIIDNGTLEAQTQYAVYVGHFYAKSCPDASIDNHLIFKGKAPRLIALHKNDKGEYDSDYSITKTHVEFYLPTDPADIYKEPVCESGNSCYIDGSCTVEFHNLAALQLNLSEAIDIPLIRTRKIGSKPGISRDFVTPLPTGCWISDVITDPATSYSTLYLHVEPLGLSYSRPFTSFADYNAAMTGLGYDALYRGKDVYVVIRDFAFQKGVDYSPEKTNINREGETEPKLHAFFYNCTFPGGEEDKGGVMGSNSNRDPMATNRKQINLLGVKEAWVEGCTFEAFNGDSYVIDFNLSTKCENGGCGITITNNTFKAGAGTRVPISVKNKVDKDPAFVKIVDNYFAKCIATPKSLDNPDLSKIATGAGVLCFADQSGKGANFPITVENNRFEDGVDNYIIMTGFYDPSKKEGIYVPVNKPFKWYYNERRGEWTAKPAFHQRVGTMIEVK